ncbi:MAG: tetratricopeptide repeat protein [Phycisphaerales bacterium]
MSQSPRIIDKATIADTYPVHAEALARGDEATVRLVNMCQYAAVAANEGRVPSARQNLEAALPQTEDPRLLFLGFQFYFRTAVAEETTAEERTAWLDIAEQLVRRRLAVVEARKDQSGVARAHTNLGLVLHYQQRHADAERHYTRAVEIDDAAGDPRGLIRSLGNLGNFYESRNTPATEGDLAAAESLYVRAIDVAERAGCPDAAGTALSNLGEINATRGNVAAARELWERVLTIIATPDDKARLYCERRLRETA